MNLLGIDIGSSSVKVSIMSADSGENLASAFYPKAEMEIMASQAGWAEQNPQAWWDNLKLAINDIFSNTSINPDSIEAIGISYQMHGLVAVDKNLEVLRPSIIWCDSRAVEIGDKALREIGAEKCLESMLNSPGNFTASKLKWVKDNEPDIYNKIYKIMLPGDYIAMRLTGQVNTTATGLSEGIMWDFKNNSVSELILDYYKIDKELIPELVPVFSVHGGLSKSVAAELGLNAGTKVAYRAGDQPNNAFSLNVLNPGEIAATAGTSGVVYGVSGEIKYDKFSRVNTFAHVNHADASAKLGVLLCISGTGILNSWLNKNIGGGQLSYVDMNNLAANVPIGSRNLSILPFGNGAERVLKNKNPGCVINNINFNTHSKNDMIRAAQEGIVFSFKYGMDIMSEIGIEPSVIRAGDANMFLSPIFRDTLAGITGSVIELYNTDGSQGAARGAGVGSGYFKSFDEAFSGLKKIQTIEPDTSKADEYQEAYGKWLKVLETII